VALTPEYVAQVYGMCRDIIAGEVILPPVAPWNDQIGYGWIEYFERMIAACSEIDAFALHTYSRGPDPASIISEDKMDAPYEMYYNGFRTYRDWLAAIPEQYRDRPVYVTETNQNDAWLDAPNEWVQTAYDEINAWNQIPSQQTIRALILYRWPYFDKYYIEGKTHVTADFQAAQRHGYKWKGEDMTWQTYYSTSMDDGFYDYDGSGELTVPFYSVPLWEHDGDPPAALARPEYDARLEPHVYTPPNAAGMFSMYSTIEGAIVYEIAGLAPGTPVRASAWAMAQDAQGSGLGMVLGIATSDPGSGAIEVEAVDGAFAGELESRALWGEWSPDVGDGHWERLWTPVVESASSRVWVLMLGRKRFADPGHTHWDDLLVEIDSEGPIEPPVEPPPTGTYTVQVLDPSGAVIASCSFEVASVNEEICGLARQIVDLACPGGG
jgi:hypothetical protein